MKRYKKGGVRRKYKFCISLVDIDTICDIGIMFMCSDSDNLIGLSIFLVRKCLFIGLMDKSVL